MEKMTEKAATPNNTKTVNVFRLPLSRRFTSKENKAIGNRNAYCHGEQNIY